MVWALAHTSPLIIIFFFAWNCKMTKKDSVKEMLSKITGQSVKLCQNTEIHFIEKMVPGIDPTVVGAYSFNDDKRKSPREQYFYLTIDGEVAADRLYKEIDMIVGMGERLEKLFHDATMQVLDVRLPKSHGFSGIKYGYRRTKELFSHAGLPAMRKSRRAITA